MNIREFVTRKTSELLYLKDSQGSAENNWYAAEGMIRTPEGEELCKDIEDRADARDQASLEYDFGHLVHTWFMRVRFSGDEW